MQYEIMFKTVRYVYKKWLRGLVEKAVKDSKTKWDDRGLWMLDKVFGYEK